MAEFNKLEGQKGQEVIQEVISPENNLSEMQKRAVKDKYEGGLLPSYETLKSNIGKQIKIERNDGEIINGELASIGDNPYFPVLSIKGERFGNYLKDIKKINLSENTIESPKDKFLQLMGPDSIIQAKDFDPKEIYKNYTYLALTNLPQDGTVSEINKIITYVEVLVNLKKSGLIDVSSSILKQIRDGIVFSSGLKDQSESEFENYLNIKLEQKLDNSLAGNNKNNFNMLREEKLENNEIRSKSSKIYKELNIQIEQSFGVNRRG